MTFDEFKAEAERLGLSAKEDKHAWTVSNSKACLVYDSRGRAATFVTSCDGNPADALREAARLMRGDVAGKLREWLENQAQNTHAIATVASGAGDSYGNQERVLSAIAVTLRDVIAKLDELEGIK